jgi:alpha-tubulin suppressor-like RCC1 family protein
MISIPTGDRGRLGAGDTKDRLSPTRVASTLSNVFAIGCACGEAHTLVWTDEGRLYGWGAGPAHGCGHMDDALEPGRVSILRIDPSTDKGDGESDGESVVEEGEGGEEEEGDDDGDGDDGVRDGTRDANSKAGASSEEHQKLHANTQTPIKNEIIVYAACGKRHSALLTIRGYVYCFGSGAGFALGTGTEDTELTPRIVSSLRSRICMHVACGGSRTAVLVRGGDVYMWGGASALDSAGIEPMTHRFARISVPDGGGVPEPGYKPDTVLGSVRREIQGGDDTEYILRRARPDPYPPALLRCALDAQVRPDVVVKLRANLVCECRDSIQI